MTVADTWNPRQSAFGAVYAFRRIFAVVHKKESA